MNERESKDRLIVALDFKEPEENLRLVSELGGAVFFFKIGLILVVNGGWKRVAETLLDEGKKVFLDLKLDDTINTVRETVAGLSEIEVRLLTLRDNTATVKAAKEGRTGSQYPKLLGLTLLSSMDESDLLDKYALSQAEVGEGFLERFVLLRANRLLAAGCDGLIASGETIGLLRREFPDTLIVSPGIRPEGSPQDEHKRVKTPREAISDGADYIVVGRPIYQAANPLDAAQRIIGEIEEATSVST